MSNIIQFGENVKGYNIRVLNEREIRAAAGILFLATFMGLMYVAFKNNFLPIKCVLTVFLSDFLIRVFINPKFSPTLIIGRLIVSNQTPEYVGAQQKKFAWIIGVSLSATMFTLMVVFNSYSLITGSICYVCLAFLFFESVFGICLGCKFYPLFHKAKPQRCPGEVCDKRSKQDIQRISRGQLLIVVAFVTVAVIAAWFLKDQYRKQPHDLFRASFHPAAKLKRRDAVSSVVPAVKKRTAESTEKKQKNTEKPKDNCGSAIQDKFYGFGISLLIWDPQGANLFTVLIQ